MNNGDFKISSLKMSLLIYSAVPKLYELLYYVGTKDV